MQIDTTDSKTALILHLQRLSTEDGPGIRTTVFFKGCPLHCGWCHNPESISAKPQLQWLENRCIGCDGCLDACPNGALTRSAAGIHIDRTRCRGCGTCARACPANALELLGKRMSLEALVSELVRDRVYFDKSGGGITLSGGEPTQQTEFLERLLQRLQEIGLHTALDTCGLCPTSSLDRLLPHTDLILFDLKEIDPDRHARFTGASNQRILENLLYVRNWLASRDLHGEKELWIRTPLIPGATDTQENLTGIGAFIAQHLPGLVARWELCAFNNLCRDKYARLGAAWEYADVPLLARERMDMLEDWAQESGVDPAIVIATGATRVAAG
jgi:pyruvate formate lyase activating enzyme